MTLNLTTITLVLRLIDRAHAMALSPAALALKAGVTAEDVSQVIAVLDGLPYVRVWRSAQTLVGGLMVSPGAAQSCSVWKIPPAVQTVYYQEGQRVAAFANVEKTELKREAQRAELERIARANGWPLLDNVRKDYIEQIAPVVLRKLQEAEVAAGA